MTCRSGTDSRTWTECKARARSVRPRRVGTYASAELPTRMTLSRITSTIHTMIVAQT